jgi:hypothetical protein
LNHFHYLPNLLFAEKLILGFYLVMDFPYKYPCVLIL